MILRRILIANRGEIAARILRSCRLLGIETVLAVSDADRDSLPARLADAVIRIGPAAPAESYLDVRAVVGAALAAGADAIHPGYGFLAENPQLARACEAAGLVFIGPTAGQLDAVGDKITARRHATAAGLRVVPGGEAASAGEAAELAAAAGWPVLVKAVAGGGVEVQLLGDGEHVIHLGDRDCSVQRRYQKLIEEAPAPLLADDLRAEMRLAAVALGKHLNYRGLGTVEFLVDCERGTCNFLEMNARIQVEHPVTEAICGLDLVAEQIWVAEGHPLRLDQASVELTGHAIECRINAEDWADGFRPCPGTVTAAAFPAGPGIRVDTHVQAGAPVPPWYDSLLAKLIVSGRDRAEALARLRAALARCEIGGVTTTLAMHAELAAQDGFARGGVDTSYLEEFLHRHPGLARQPATGARHG